MKYSELKEELLKDPATREAYRLSRLAHSFGHILTEYRIEHGITQIDLARLLGWQQSKVAFFESGEKTPTYRTLCNVCKKLNKDVYVFFVDRPKNITYSSGPTTYIEVTLGGLK